MAIITVLGGLGGGVIATWGKIFGPHEKEQPSKILPVTRVLTDIPESELQTKKAEFLVDDADIKIEKQENGIYTIIGSFPKNQ